MLFLAYQALGGKTKSALSGSHFSWSSELGEAENSRIWTQVCQEGAAGRWMQAHSGGCDAAQSARENVLETVRFEPLWSMVTVMVGWLSPRKTAWQK